MKFECDGVVYDSDQMLQPQIKDPYIVALYITPDYSCVFGVYMNQDSGVVVHRIQGERLQSLAQSLQNPELLKAWELDKSTA